MESSPILAQDSRGLQEKVMNRMPSLPYVAPFAAFLLFIALRSQLPYEYPIRVIVVTAIVLLVSRRVLTWRLSSPVSSVLVGIAIFVIWIAPDLISSAYRQSWLFHNALVGQARSSLPESLKGDGIFLWFRIAGTALLVPVIEEIFWRGWLMRYLISPRFETIRLGAYSAVSFWASAILFASEHGPYWDVGLIAGIIFNLLMIRTRALADCILAHAVTNACLAAYVLIAGQWQYWL